MTLDPITAPDAFGQGFTLELLYAPGQYDGEECRWIITIRRAKLGQTSIVIEAGAFASLITQMDAHARLVANGIQSDIAIENEPQSAAGGRSGGGPATAIRATGSGLRSTTNNDHRRPTRRSKLVRSRGA